VILGQEIIYNFAMFISKIIDYQDLSDEQLKRRLGVYKQTCRKMVESVKSVEADSNSASTRGPNPKLSIEEQVDGKNAFTIGKLPFKRKKSFTQSSRDTGHNGNGCNGNSHRKPPKETERFFWW